jgi:hypothetical protein
MKCGRNSIGVEVQPTYLMMAKHRAEKEANGLVSAIEVRVERDGGYVSKKCS